MQTNNNRRHCHFLLYSTATEQNQRFDEVNPSAQRGLNNTRYLKKNCCQSWQSGDCLLLCGLIRRLGHTGRALRHCSVPPPLLSHKTEDSTKSILFSGKSFLCELCVKPWCTWWLKYLSFSIKNPVVRKLHLRN